ncbi:barstar family protein [Methanobrevibacter sp.]|uniref:barstar family protein n=1 Tax=Methanobrevibacter sp. TaxID=66852 RepID=UPI0025EBCDFC|nr:barstar family protein [Methanobrevibacter sp.]MBQ6512939.1 barstar family protein [Methanobrevibacter sp.]
MKLDGNLIKEMGHDYLKDALNFPDYYGKNLDALYDCLCEIGVETEIVLINGSEVSSDLIDTFIDAASENDFLKFRCES